MPPRSTTPRPLASIAQLLAGALLAVACSAGASPIYRWVDENGRTHVADTVPERYRKSATRIDTGGSEVSPEQQKEAQARAAKEKALAEDLAKRRAAAAPAAPASAASAAGPGKRPEQGVTADTDCDTWWRLFRESEDCFGAYRVVGGGIKVEAFERCNSIPSPEPTCGPLKR